MSEYTGNEHTHDYVNRGNYPLTDPFSTLVDADIHGGNSVDGVPDTESVAPSAEQVETGQQVFHVVSAEDWNFRVLALEKNQAHISEQLDRLTGAVNTFGEMMNFIVNTVQGIAGQFTSGGGIAGLMGMLGKGKADDNG